MDTMIEAPSRLFTSDDLERLLYGLITPSGTLCASSGLRFRGGEYGRDSLYCALFGINYDPHLAGLVLVSLAGTQGMSAVSRRGEMPGCIAHHRRYVGAFGSVPEIELDLIEQYGLAGPGLILMHSSADTTALWVNVLGEYCRRYGHSILHRRSTHFTGEVRNIKTCFEDCMGWIVRTIKSSPIGLLEYARTNPVHDFHTLRDGGLSYIHEDGSALNVSDRIAYLEVQGLAYDALHAGARLIEAERADEAESWKGLARELKQSFLKYFWMEDQKNFAIALDRDPVSLKVRQVKLLSSVQPELLGSTIFDKLPEEERTYYVESVARALFTDEFLTDIGIRSMALRHNKLFNGCYTYQGPCTVWPIMTHLAARGLRYQGLHALARDLSVRMLNGIHAEGECREFLHVAPDGSVIYDPKEGDLAGAIFTTDIGELDQAWTIAAALEANRVILPIEIRATDFERRLLPAGEPTRLLTLNQVRNAFFLRRQVKLNLEKGKCIERELSIKLGYGPPHHPEDKVLGPP